MITAGLLLAGSGTGAQPVPYLPPSETNLAEASREFQRGVELLDSRNYAQAIVALERSLSLRESAAALYNLGLARRGQGGFLQAIRAFERFLAIARPTNAARRGAAQMIAELRPRIAHAHVTVTGGSGSVLLDGNPLPAGTDGPYDLELDPGLRVFEARREGHQPAREERTIHDGEAVQISLDASAHPLPARLHVELDDPAGVIRVDGVELARGRFDGELVAGSHRFEFIRGSRTEHREATLAPGSDERWPTVVLIPDPRVTVAPPHAGRAWYRNGWVWAGIGGGVALVATAVVVGVVVGTQPDPPQGGSFGRVLQGAALTP